ncbi:hypothetical protein [Paraburkholderia sp. SG-MS1]|uniref:hypothetical protein n=1 Tax=Paraburkholderia sp. SG-MS1 TaxID=2023741 RepID=UPI001EE9DEA0|nr:hypothetical protein [Paraburkholderia sp. SG-MS1]
MQLQADYTGMQTGQVRWANISVSKAFDLLGASKAGMSNVPGASVTHPASINFIKTGASLSHQRMAAENRHRGLGHRAVQRGFAADLGAKRSGSRKVINRAKHRAIRAGAPCSTAIARSRPASPVCAPSRVCLLRYGARLSARGHAVVVKALVDCVRLAHSDAKYDSLDLSVAKAVGDAPVQSASRSPRINARVYHQLN